MNSAVDRWRSLVEALYARTIEGKIDWKIADIPFVVFDGVKITIEEVDGNNFERDIKVSIQRGGEEIDGFRDTDIREYSPVSVEEPGYFRLMSNLHVMARRKALGADGVLDSLLTSLGAPSIDSDLDDDVPF